MFEISRNRFLLSVFSVLIPLHWSVADSAVVRKPGALDRFSMFKKDFAGDFSSLIVQDVSASGDADEPVAATQPIKDGSEARIAKQAKIAKSEETPKPKKPGAVFVGDFKPGDLLPPDETPRIRINPDAPSPFIGMAMAHMEGDNETAAKYADQWVRYQQNFIFEVRELTRLVGEALIRQKAISEDDWQGVSQYIDYETAMQRKSEGSIFKATHEQAMARIKPDPNNEAGVYFFFHMNCGNCRLMAPDVERLYRAFQKDQKVRMVALTLGPTPATFVSDYRKHTGLTMPIFDGEKVAKQFGVGFSPAIVVVAPNSRQAYLKTGQQSFYRMYEFVRRVQGLPAVVTPEVTQLAATKIGAIENARLEFGQVPEHLLRPKEREKYRLAKRLNFGATSSTGKGELGEVKF
jgi:thiol-disulfide isomerase/thioredoxin